MRYVLLALALVLAVGSARAEEYCGLLAGWADLKRDYGAAGDGKTDDTAALQRALDELGEPGKPCVLWIPAGEYVLTRTLKMTSQMNVSVLGEAPGKVVLSYRGPAGQDMLTCNGVRYSRFVALEWRGNALAKAGVMHAWDGKSPGADTHCEHVDETFRDLEYGIRGGTGGFMDAECPVIHCSFIGCTKAGVSIENFNALDWWIWDSAFDNCQVGVTNDPGAGHFHVYNTLFSRSREADMKMANTSYFGIRWNTSRDSAAFFRAAGIGAGAPTTFLANTVIQPFGSEPLRLGNMGPFVLLDNAIDAKTAPAVRISDAAACLSAGNTSSAAPLVAGGRRILSMDDRVAPLKKKLAAGWADPRRVYRPVIEVKPGADAAAIQAAIDSTAKMRGQRPIVHLPHGDYAISRTLVIPAGSDLQFTGDGYCTVLRWTGEGEGTVLSLPGPAKATLRDLSVDGAGKAVCIAATNCDQPGARIFGEQAEVQGAREVGFLADGLTRARLEMRDFYHSDCKGIAVKSVGVPSVEKVNGVAGANGRAGLASRLCIFGGASSNNTLSYDVRDGGRILAEDIWYEGGPPGFLNLTGSGEFTLNGAEVACADPNHGGSAGDVYGIDVNGFRGDVALVNVLAPTQIRVRGDGRATRFLGLGVQGRGDDFFQCDAAGAQWVFLGGLKYTEGGGAAPLPDRGRSDAAFAARMLRPLREERPRPLDPVPAGATDLRLYRVNATNGRIGIWLRAR